MIEIDEHVLHEELMKAIEIAVDREIDACAALCAERAKKALDKDSPLERKAYLAAARAIKSRKS